MNSDKKILIVEDDELMIKILKFIGEIHVQIHSNTFDPLLFGVRYLQQICHQTIYI